MIEKILQFIVNFVRFFATNEIVLGITSMVGIAGFILTIIVSIQTSKIKKILQYNQITNQYNKERTGFQNSFAGHLKSIVEDNIKSDKLLKDILALVESYRVKFTPLLSRRERADLRSFIKMLKKQADKVNWNVVCNHLSILSGRLTKKGDKKNV